MITTDILFDPATNDLEIVSGDLVIGDSTLQHQYDVLMADKAHYKVDPSLGVGLVNYTNDLTAMPGLVKSIRAELERDGQQVDTVTIQPNGSVTIKARFLQ